MKKETPYHLYEVLGVDKNASAEAIKQGYIRQVKINHPDVGGDSESFVAVVNAYNILKDEKSKAEYDQQGGIIHPSLLEGVQTLRKDSMQLIMNTFQEILATTPVELLPTLDVMESIRAKFRSVLANSSKLDIKYRHDIQIVEKLIKRIKTNKEGVNPFVAVLNTTVEGLNDTILKLSYEKKLLENALDEMSAYSSPVEFMSGYGYSQGFNIMPETTSATVTRYRGTSTNIYGF
jgi:curved DNA-binding protein CbpA